MKEEKAFSAFWDVYSTSFSERRLYYLMLFRDHSSGTKVNVPCPIKPIKQIPESKTIIIMRIILLQAASQGGLGIAARHASICSSGILTVKVNGNFAPYSVSITILLLVSKTEKSGLYFNFIIFNWDAHQSTGNW